MEKNLGIPKVFRPELDSQLRAEAWVHEPNKEDFWKTVPQDQRPEAKRQKRWRDFLDMNF